MFESIKEREVMARLEAAGFRRDYWAADGLITPLLRLAEGQARSVVDLGGGRFELRVSGDFVDGPNALAEMVRYPAEKAGYVFEGQAEFFKGKGARGSEMQLVAYTIREG